MNSFRTKAILWISISVLLLGICILLSLSFGEMTLYPWQWIGVDIDSVEWTILTRLRLPRTLTALGVGGMLALSGTILQGIFKNPLVEPYTLGLSGGGALGVALAFVLGLAGKIGIIGLSVFAFTGSILVGLILLTCYRFNSNVGNLLLTGIMLSILCSSLTTLFMSLSSPETMSQIIYWTMGSLENNGNERAFLLLSMAILGLLSTCLLSQQINILNLGVDTARHLGVNTSVLIPILLIIASLLTSVSVAQAGIIGFVGLLVPHILRKTAGGDYRLLVPLSFLSGGIFLIICDLIARIIIYPNQLPVGVVSGIFGGSLFVYLLLKSGKKNSSHV